MKNMLSCNSIADSENWYDFPYFPTLFKKAGFDVYFWDNQFDMDLGIIWEYALNSYIHNDSISDITYTQKNQGTFKYDGQLFDNFKQTVQNTFWAQFKENLSAWRFNPASLGNYLHAYAEALVQKRTNVNPAQFVVLSLELAELTASDFAVEQPQGKQKKKNKKSTETAVAETETPEKRTESAEGQPLKVIILNASGQKGLAESLKQYLRAQYAKGLLQVDVYDTGNYPSLQDHSFIEDYSGRLVQVTQVSHAIGISGEIHSQKSAGELYYDSRIVLGKDFKMPL